MNEVNWIEKGWECPKCGAVMSPYTSSCVNCTGFRGAFIETETKDTDHLAIYETLQSSEIKVGTVVGKGGE